MSNRWTVVEASTIYVDLPGLRGFTYAIKLPRIFVDTTVATQVERVFGPAGKYRVRTIVERDDEADDKEGT